ncbi:DUF3037 domain-containing protein [Portibacter lacus]|uniref:DUF3037 domain-containing protein n=1 Tax=Portibacter lacus TaxID=1099794 RepID=A0AA37SN15_9BACT|nr:DUF3037 domain-containing protein [Portibacter lacus]GLR17491.1 hypothetical protein GCM10007940_21060 [Portibacter lacus]
MPKQETFEYAIIRLVPRVEREEFLNIGVIVFSKRLKYLNVKYNLNAERLRVFSEEVDLDEVAEYLNSWSLICEGSSAGGPIAQCDMPYRFRWLTANRSTIIQSSKVHSGISDSPETVLEQLFAKYVL